ncbi:hypothetical protein GJAV_G00261030 [Gymnothorax javanicus]|nr:hypothetical protein GJAV_G00261030 [Gymnothorax javanicus]
MRCIVSRKELHVSTKVQTAMAVPTPPIHVPCPSTPGPSVSLLETIEDTRLVLGAFLRQSLDIPLAQRPGRIGGAYKDHHKYSANEKEYRRRPEDDWDSLDERISTAEEKKHGFKDSLKKRLRRTVLRRTQKDASKKETRVQDGAINGDVQTGLAKLDVSGKTNSIDRTQLSQDKRDSEFPSSASSSDEGSANRERKKKKKKKSPFSSLLRKLKPKDEEKENTETRPKRPDSLKFTVGGDPETTPVSPSRPPEFYDELAETLDKIAQKHTAKLSPVHPPPCSSETNDKDAVIGQLVQVLSMQADAINAKIQSDPFLRSSLARLSYPSFAKLLDAFATRTEAPVTAPASSTLTRVAVTMEVSRRIVTATGAQRMEGYAEKYMNNFVPWVQSQGGWENIVQSDDFSEYD